ncbi:MAG TPA: P-II family nitrogen regulator [Desulfobacteraceae bacterium]|nr:P-II family nitrogen regulator [Desulfobacteraceae bacterium]
MRFKIILASVKSEITDKIVDAVKKEGATGATIIPARGTGIKEAKTFFGLTLEAQTDIIMLLAEEHVAEKLLTVIKKAGEFGKPGTGIAFMLPVEHVVGLESQIEKFKQRARDSYL